MTPIQFNPMRSLIFVHCPKEKFRHKLIHWMYFHHVQESMAQFGPYVSKYTYHWALPIPEEGERFGTRNFNLAEHYWLVNPMDSRLKVKAIAEYMPPEALVWQGTLPDKEETLKMGMLKGDEGRSTGRDAEDGTIPFVWAFVPMWWEEDFKGSGRTLADGYNYRWLFVIKYPEGVSKEDGDKWFYNDMIPVFQAMKQTTRILSSSVIQEVNDCPYQRMVEIWFDDNEGWHDAVMKEAATIKKPSWASIDYFPYLKPQTEIVGEFLSDRPGDDHYSQYGGFRPMR